MLLMETPIAWVAVLLPMPAPVQVQAQEEIQEQGRKEEIQGLFEERNLDSETAVEGWLAHKELVVVQKRESAVVGALSNKEVVG